MRTSAQVFVVLLGLMGLGIGVNGSLALGSGIRVPCEDLSEVTRFLLLPSSGVCPKPKPKPKPSPNPDAKS